MTTLTIDELLQENEDLRRRLEEAEQTLHAIQAGEVDAVLIEAKQVYTLETLDNPYRLLVARIPHPAVMLTVDGSIISCNRLFGDLLQRPPASLRGRPINDFIAPDSQAALEALLQGGRTTEVQGTVALLRDDGTSVSAYLGVSALREGALGLCLMVTDLTEQQHYEELRRAQAALRDSEAKLAAELADAKLLQSISAQLIQEDNVDVLYRQIVEAASALMRSDMSSMQMLRPERNELELLAWKGFHPESAAFWKRVRIDSETSCGEALRNGGRVIVPDVETCEFIVDLTDVEANRRSGIRGVQSTPLMSRTGRLLGMLSTHWRRPHRPSERELRLIDVLARQAADLIERKHAEMALRDADRNKDEFLATLAHELRNPLAPIRNAMQILIAKGAPDPELQWARSVINRQVQLMARLLEDLLDVSRISHNKLELRMERVGLAAVLELALETSRPLIEAGGHELTIALPPEPIHVHADPARLAQAFANLLNNAAKYTEEGGCIRLSAERQGSVVAVSVKDNGIGIAADVLPRIFEIFSQAKPALVRSQGGLGVGLSLVKGLVQLHGGSIEARSQGAGQGSEFVIRLPVAAETSMEPARPGERDRKRPVLKRRILIADDNQDSADTLAKLLSIMGHEVGTTYDGEQAVQAAEALRPEIVLLDIGMPKLDGYEACCRIREQPWGQGMYLIALTGWGQAEDQRRTEEAGFNCHMVKPVDLDALMTLLASLAE